MADLDAAEQTAITAVAMHCSGTWEAGSAYLAIAGQRVAIEVLTLAPRSPAATRTATPRLREDRVAQRVLRDLEVAVGGHVPDGRAVLVTLGAPIKVPGKLVAELADRLRRRLAGDAADTDVRMDILGNRVRFRVLRDGSAWTRPVNGFVFSGDPPPGDLAHAMGALRDQILLRARRPARRRPTGGRWLVLACGGPIADGGTYRRCLSRLSLPDAFAKILLVTAGRRVEVVAGERSQRTAPESSPHRVVMQ